MNLTSNIKQYGVICAISLFLLCTIFSEDVMGMQKERGRIRFGGNGFVGFPMKEHKIGETTNGDDVCLSGGGGIGGGIILGLVLISKLDIDLELGTETSRHKPDASGGDGNFRRNFILSTLKYKIPAFSDKGLWKIGVGLGSYSSGTWVVDVFTVTPAYRESMKYKASLGYHITGEYESFFKSGIWSITFGVKYYNVTYNIDSFTLNGVSLPTSSLEDKYKKLDGSGIDMILALVRYF